jgi:hypothetical protein
VLIPKGGDNRLFRKASGLCYFAGSGTQSHATSISCLVHRRLSHLSDIFIHGRGHPTMIRYFVVHADQRMKLFNFFLILSGLILGAFPGVRAMAPQSKLVSLLPMLLVLVSFIFWRLDERTRQLIRNAESALRFLDVEWSLAPLSDGSPHYLQIIERDEYLMAIRPRRWWKRVFPISYGPSRKYHCAMESTTYLRDL